MAKLDSLENLYRQAVVEASNREHREQVDEYVLNNKIGAVWNMAAQILNKHGRPTLVEDGQQYERKHLYRASTGLLELSGMTGDLGDVIPAVRISSDSDFNDRPKAVEIVDEPNPRHDMLTMTFQAYMLHPESVEDNEATYRVRETQGGKFMRYLPKGVLGDVLSLRSDTLHAAGEAITHPETDEPLKVTIRRPHHSSDTWYERDNESLEQELDFLRTRTYQDMSLLYEIIGATGEPLRNKPGFAQK